jgi:hypothetical protein
MTETNPTSSAELVPAALVEEGKDAFAAGLKIRSCPYSGESRFLWLCGYSIASAAADGDVDDYARFTAEDMLADYRDRNAYRRKFAERFKTFRNNNEHWYWGFHDIAFGVIIRDLCAGYSTYDDFMEAVDEAVEEHRWIVRSVGEDDQCR